MRTLNWRWLGRQVELVPLGLVVLYAVGVGGTLNGLVVVPLRTLTLGLLLVLGGLWLFRSRSREALPRFVAPLLGLCLATAITTLFSRDPRLSLTYLAYTCALALAYWAVADWVAGEEVRLEITLCAALAVLVAVSLHELRLWLAKNDWRFVSPYMRPSSLMGSPNIYATLLLVAGPLVARRALIASSWLVRGLLLLCLALLGALLILAGSRAAWLGAALGGVAFVLLGLAVYRLLSVPALRDRLRAAPRSRQAVLALLVILLVAAIAAALPFVVAQATDATHGTASLRPGIWEAAIWQFGRTPLFGRGPFTYGDALLERVSTPPESPHAHAHNFVLNFAAEEGLLGLAALAWLAWTAFEAVRSRLRSQDPSERLGGATAAALLVAVVAHNMFDFTLIPGLALLTLWALTVLLPEGSPGPPPSLSAVALRRWVAPLLWLLVVGLLAFPLPAARAASRAAADAARGDWTAAAVDYEVALRRDPALTIYRFDAAYVYAQLALQGDEEALSRAIDLYRQALARHPEYALHWANLALLEYRAGQTEAALADMRRAVEHAPTARVFDQLGDIMARGGNLSTDEMPPLRGYGYGITYSLNRYHVRGPDVYLLPLPEADVTP